MDGGIVRDADRIRAHLPCYQARRKRVFGDCTPSSEIGEQENENEPPTHLRLEVLLSVSIRKRIEFLPYDANFLKGKLRQSLVCSSRPPATGI